LTVRARSGAYGAASPPDSDERSASATAGAPGGSLAFDSLFRELAPYVLRVLPRMGVAAADLDDVAQDVFLAVHRGLPGFEGRSSAKTWVYGICIRACSNYRQRAHRRREQLVATVPETGDAHSPERSVAASHALATLDAVLCGLPEPQRAVFVLFEIEQLAVTEIAEALGCSKFTVYARLYAARRAVAAGMHAHASRGGER
jgi:RNA polymerase sigma-70 factor (ECF subfamily)